MHLNLASESDTFDKKLRTKDCVELLDAESAISCLKMKVLFREGHSIRESECPSLLEALFELSKDSGYISLALICCFGLEDDESRRKSINSLKIKYSKLDLDHSIQSSVENFLSKKILDTASFATSFSSCIAFGSQVGISAQKILQICEVAILEHNLLVISRSYSKIYLVKMDTLCNRSRADIVLYLHKLINSGKIRGLINAKDDYVEFMNQSNVSLGNSDTIEHCRHLIRKEVAGSTV